MEQQLQECIEACDACALACDFCATACLREEDVGIMVGCIAADMDCAEICRTASAFMARGSQLASAVCQACAQVCDACAEACEPHSMQHCQDCAAACRRCADQCRHMSMIPGADADDRWQRAAH